MGISVNFLRGLQANLANAPKTNGTFYLTEDTNRLYACFEDNTTPVLLNQMVKTVASVKNLPTTNVETNLFYYCIEENVLAIYNGTGWVQINPDTDTGATSVEMAGSGNAVTSVSYDALTRKLTFTKEETFATKAELTTVSEYIGTIPNDTDKSVIDYVNTKAQEVLDAATGGSSESAASVKQQLDTYIETNNTAVAKAQSTADIAKENAATAQKTADEAKQAAANAVTTAAADATSKANTAKTEAISEAKTETENQISALKTETITPLTNRVTTAEGEIDAIQDTLAKIANPMIYKGVVNSDVELTGKETDAEAGHTYMVATSGTYEGNEAEVGDLFIWDGTAWAYVPAGDDAELDTTYQIQVSESTDSVAISLFNEVTKIANGHFYLKGSDWIGIDGTSDSSNHITFYHKAPASGEAVESGDAINLAPTKSFTAVTKLEKDSRGHVTSAEINQITVPTYTMSGSVEVQNNVATFAGVLTGETAASRAAHQITSDNLVLTKGDNDIVKINLEWGTF